MKCPMVVKEALSAKLLLRAGDKAVKKYNLLEKSLITARKAGMYPNCKPLTKAKRQIYKFLDAGTIKNIGKRKLLRGK